MFTLPQPGDSVGIVPNVVTQPEAAGPPTEAEFLQATLTSLKREVLRAARQESAEPPGRTFLARLRELSDSLRRRTGRDMPAVPPHSLIALRDLLPLFAHLEAALAKFRSDQLSRLYR